MFACVCFRCMDRNIPATSRVFSPLCIDSMFPTARADFEHGCKPLVANGAAVVSGGGNRGVFIRQQMYTARCSGADRLFLFAFRDFSRRNSTSLFRTGTLHKMTTVSEPRLNAYYALKRGRTVDVPSILAVECCCTFLPGLLTLDSMHGYMTCRSFTHSIADAALWTLKFLVFQTFMLLDIQMTVIISLSHLSAVILSDNVIQVRRMIDGASCFDCGSL